MIRQLTVVVNNQPISQTGAAVCLEFQRDEKRRWDCLVEMICKKVSAGVGAIRRTRNVIPVP